MIAGYGSIIDYGCSLDTRFMETGDLEVLNGAIEASEDAVAAALPGDNWVRDWRSSFSIWLFCRFQSLGMANDLDRAIQAAELTVIAGTGLAYVAWSLRPGR